MSQVDIQFDKNELDVNTKIILNASTSVEAQEIKKSYKIIIQTALKFIEKYQIMIEQISNFETALKHTIKAWHSFKANCKVNGTAYKDTTEYDIYLKERSRIRRQNFSQEIKKGILETYQLAMKFQQYLNAALGQMVATTYVWVGAKGVPETYVINDMSDFLKVDVDRYGNVVVRYRNNAKMLREHATKVEQSIQQDTKDFNYSSLKSTYNTAYQRFNKYKKSGGGAFILWLYPYEGQKWNGVLVSSFGSINEAYATLLLHEHFTHSNVPEDNMEQFMSYVMQVTNLSGTLEGDTTVNNMQMAVKSNQATTLSIEQLFNMAQEIINNKLNNFQAIQNYLIKKKKENKEIQRPINVSLKQVLQNIANETIGETINSIRQK